MQTVKRSKRFKKREQLVDREKRYALVDAVRILKKVDAIKDAKFDETIVLNFQLGIKTDSGTENVRGAVSLPHGSGKKVRVVAFAKGDGAREAKDNGADEVGAEELVAKILGGWMEFDAVVASLILDNVSKGEMEKSVEAFSSRLKPNGLLYAIFNPLLTAEQIREIMKKTNNPTRDATSVIYSDKELRTMFYAYSVEKTKLYEHGLRGLFLKKH